MKILSIHAPDKKICQGGACQPSKLKKAYISRYEIKLHIAVQVLEQLSGVKGVLVTAGSAGCSYAFKGSGGKIDYTGLVPVLKVKADDTTGAGDAFLAGFLASMVKVISSFFVNL